MMHLHLQQNHKFKTFADGDNTQLSATTVDSSPSGHFLMYNISTSKFKGRPQGVEQIH